MNARQRLQQLTERINGLNLRERGLLALATLALVFLFSDLFIMKPVHERQQRVQSELERVNERIGQLSRSLQALVAERRDDPNLDLHRRIDALESEIDAMESRLATAHDRVGVPREAIGVLAGLLQDRPGLHLVSLENLAAERLRDNGAAVPGLFVHRVRLVIEANHAGIRDYLGLVSALPRGVYLESLHLTVPEWPRNRVELVLFSLTLDDQWLGV